MTNISTEYRVIAGHTLECRVSGAGDDRRVCLATVPLSRPAAPKGRSRKAPPVDETDREAAIVADHGAYGWAVGYGGSGWLTGLQYPDLHTAVEDLTSPAGAAALRRVAGLLHRKAELRHELLAVNADLTAASVAIPGWERI